MDYRHHNPSYEEDYDLYRYLWALPKIDLHRHLEGALRLSTLADIAEAYQIDVPGYEIESFRHLVQMVPSDPLTADVFISKFDVLRNFYRSPDIIQRVAYEAVADAAADNIAYLELRFTPIALAREMGYDLADVTSWVLDAVEEAKFKYGLEVGLIISMNRHESAELGEQHVDLAIANRHRGIAAVDLAGAENHFPALPFLPAIQRAREAGLAVTIHAGEWAGPENVVQAIRDFKATRIGHGVRTMEDPQAVQMALDHGIAFEVCPTSNIQSGVVNTEKQHPLQSMRQAGLITTINTDDPSICGIAQTDELMFAMKNLGFSLDEIKQQILNAAQAAFLPDDQRKQLINDLRQALQISQTT